MHFRQEKIMRNKSSLIEREYVRYSERTWLMGDVTDPNFTPSRPKPPFLSRRKLREGYRWVLRRTDGDQFRYSVLKAETREDARKAATLILGKASSEST